MKVKVPREFRTGTVRAAELPLPAGVRARRDGDESASSSSPEPAENDPRRANAIGDATARTASAAAAGTDHLDAPKHPRYDRDDAGVFPPRPLCNWTESNHTRAMPEGRMDDAARGVGVDPPEGAAFGWVPSGADEAMHFVRPRTAELPVRKETSAALELFDDPELELESPESRVSRGSAGDDPSAPGVGARSRYFTQHGQFAWAPCWVLSHDPSDDTFEIEWRDAPGVRKRARRLNLVFDAEDPAAFRTRLRKATTLRDDAEAAARYHALVDRMDFIGDIDAVLTPEWVRRVEGLADRGLATRLPEAAAAFMDESREVYRRAEKRALLDLTLRDRARAKRIREEMDVAPIDPPRLAPEIGVVNVRGGSREGRSVEDSFDVILEDIDAMLPLADHGFLAAHQTFYRRLDARELLLTARADDGGPCTPKRPMTLESYESFSRKHLDAARERLETDFVTRTCALCVDLEETTHDFAMRAEDPDERAERATRLEKLPRFQTQLALSIRDQLRTVVQNSVASIADFWTRGFGGGDAAAEAAPHHAHHVPLLEVKLIVSDGAAAFDPPLASVRDVALALFDDAVAAAQNIKDIRGVLAAQKAAADPLVDDDEPPPPTPAVPAPDAKEPFVSEARAAIAATLEENFPGPEALAERFAAFAELMAVPEPEPEVAPEAEAGEGDAEGETAGEDAKAEGEEKVDAESGAATAEGGAATAEGGAATAEGGAATAEGGAATAEGGAATAEGAAPAVEEEEPDEEEEPAELTLPEIEAEMRRLADLADTVNAVCDNFVPFRMIGVSCVEIKMTLVEAALDARQALLDKLVADFHAANGEAYARFCEITDVLARDCTNPEELDALRKYMMSSVEEIAELEKHLVRCKEMAAALETAEENLSEEVVDTYWNAITQPATMPGKLVAAEERAAEWKKRFTDELKADIAALMVEISEARAVVDDFIEQGDINAVEDRLVAVQEIDSNLARLKAKGDLYKSREVLFERPETPYPALTALIKEFEPYGNMWRVAAEFSRSLPQWMNGPFTSLDPEKTTNDVDRWSRAIVKMMKSLKGVPMEVCEELRDKVTGFGENLPLIVALRNPGLRERHWKEMSEELGFPVKADASFSLTRALQLELPKHIESIERYSDFASKEFSLERTLDQMLVNWQGVSFETTPWRDTGSSILKGTEETQMLLDDQIVNTQSMRSSPYIGPFEDRVNLREKKLTTIQEVLDQWLKMQSGWLYLEPIFGSDDIMQQMPTEGRKFRTVDSTWRKTIAKLELTSEVLTVGSDEELLGSLQKCNELLDEVNKGLSDYLETKRLAFPRFYFLSNDELLEILSETKDPLRVQPYLKKVFEAINLLEFQKNLEVTAMISEEGEKVKFKKSFNPAKAGGAVEKWLIECEAAQRETVAMVCQQSSDAYATSERTDWMVTWPGQVVLCIGSLYWTSQTESAISNGTMPEHAKMCGAQLMDIVEKVRGQLTKLQRKTLSALS